jgi:hypothetical protein
LWSGCTSAVSSTRSLLLSAVKDTSAFRRNLTPTRPLILLAAARQVPLEPCDEQIWCILKCRLSFSGRGASKAYALISRSQDCPDYPQTQPLDLQQQLATTYFLLLYFHDLSFFHQGSQLSWLKQSTGIRFQKWPVAIHIRKLTSPM